MNVKEKLGSIGRFSAKNNGKVFLAIIVLLVVSFVGLMSVEMSMGMDLYIDEDSSVNENWQTLQGDFGKGNEVFLILEVEDGDVYDPSFVNDVESLYEDLYETEMFTFVTSLAHPIKAGPGGGEVPENRDEVIHSIQATRDNHRTADVMIESLNPDNQTAIIIAQYGNIDVPEGEDRLYGFLPATEEDVVQEKVNSVVSDIEFTEDVEVTITGSPIFEEAAFGMMLPEMIKLFGYAMMIIILVVFLVMKSRVRSYSDVLLPLITSVVTLSVMVGFMGFFGYRFNAIMLGVLPIALGLSIDYGLQIQTRYLEERDKGRSPTNSAEIASKSTGKALAFAMTTTLIGLGALMISEVPPVRQFGATAGFSILVAMLLSVTLLPSFLVLKDGGSGKVTSNSSEESTLERWTCKFSELVCGKNKFVLLVLFVAILLGAFSYPQVDTTQEMLDYWPEIQERSDLERLEDTVDSPKIMHAIVDFDDYAYELERFEKVSDFESDLEELEHVNTVLSPGRAIEMDLGHLPENETEFRTALDSEKNVDRPPTLGKDIDDNYPNRILVQMFVEDIEGKPIRNLIDDIYDKSEEYFSNESVSVTGKPVLNRNVIENVTAGLTEMTVLSFSLVLVFLSVALWSLKDSLVLVGSVSVSAVLLVAGSMYIFGIPWNPLTVTVASIILGIGIDYGVHVYERYKEELEKGKDVNSSVVEALTKKSRPILGSGLTTMLGFGVLILSDFPVLANFGRAILLAMVFALLATFLGLPSVLILVDDKD